MCIVYRIEKKKIIRNQLEIVEFVLRAVDTMIVT